MDRYNENDKNLLQPEPPCKALNYHEWPSENPGLTSAGVRFHFTHQFVPGVRIPESWIFDLGKVEYYHEFVNYDHIEFWGEYIEGRHLIRIVFTTEYAVRDFRFLEIIMNDRFFGKNADESARAYFVTGVLYYLDELAPGMPFIITGANMGSVFALNGFSFVDEYGVTRYFAFTWGNPEFDPIVFIHEF